MENTSHSSQIYNQMGALDILSQEYLPAVEEALKERVSLAGQDNLGLLREMLAYHMGWEGEGSGPEARGKRIRPLLVLLSTESVGGYWKQALPAASAVELVHNFSLIHDDIEDCSPLRRGRPTVWKLWGISQAINAGDTMFALSHLEILKLEATTSISTAFQAAQLLQETCLYLTQGQFLDLTYENRSDVTLDDYWNMTSGKTAALLSTCTKLGPLVAGRSAQTQSRYAAFGRYLGLAFQAQDDLLGIWGEAELTGKSAESDLITGKKSLPVLYGLSQKGEFARRWESGPIPREEVAEVAVLLEKDGGRVYTEMMAEQLTTKALQSMADAQFEGIAGEALRQLTHQLLKRRV